MKGHLSFEQTLIYNGEELEDVYFLNHYNIVKHATIVGDRKQRSE